MIWAIWTMFVPAFRWIPYLIGGAVTAVAFLLIGYLA